MIYGIQYTIQHKIYTPVHWQKEIKHQPISFATKYTEQEKITFSFYNEAHTHM